MATKHEIEAILKDEQQLNELVRCAFNAIDTDGSGDLDIEELHTMLTPIAEETNQESLSVFEIKSVMQELDTATDGSISFEEFKVLIVAVL